MANTDISMLENFVDKRIGRGVTATVLSSAAVYNNVSALRTRLTAINATSYTSARLDLMTENDMVYAVRLNDDAAGIR